MRAPQFACSVKLLAQEERERLGTQATDKFSQAPIGTPKSLKQLMLKEHA